MRCWTLALAAGLAASAFTGRGPALKHSRGGEKAALVPRPEMAEAEALFPLTINVSAHLVTTPGGKQLSQEALDGQMAIINRSFAPHKISFVLVETERIVDPLWGEGIDELRMMWDSNRGDARTLNLYFVQGFREDPTREGYTYAPHRIPRDRGTYRVDGAVVASYTVPGGPGWDAGRWEGKAAVRGIGLWLGLLNPAVGGCSGRGDLVDDTPAAMGNASFGLCPGGLDSCPDQPGLDPIHNFMSSTTDACKTEFTPGQARRMHQQWQAFRAPHRAPTGPMLSAIEPVEAEGKLPYYPRPTSLMAALVQCLPHEANVTRETREDRCGTFIYCYFGTWKAASTGEAYASNNTWIECEEARADPPDEEWEEEEEEAARRVRRRRASPLDLGMFSLWAYWDDSAIYF